MMELLVKKVLHAGAFLVCFCLILFPVLWIIDQDEETVFSVSPNLERQVTVSGNSSGGKIPPVTHEERINAYFSRIDADSRPSLKQAHLETVTSTKDEQFAELGKSTAPTWLFGTRQSDLYDFESIKKALLVALGIGLMTMLSIGWRHFSLIGLLLMFIEAVPFGVTVAYFYGGVWLLVCSEVTKELKGAPNKKRKWSW